MSITCRLISVSIERFSGVSDKPLNRNEDQLIYRHTL